MRRVVKPKKQAERALVAIGGCLALSAAALVPGAAGQQSRHPDLGPPIPVEDGFIHSTSGPNYFHIGNNTGHTVIHNRIVHSALGADDVVKHTLGRGTHFPVHPSRFIHSDPAPPTHSARGAGDVVKVLSDASVHRRPPEDYNIRALQPGDVVKHTESSPNSCGTSRFSILDIAPVPEREGGIDCGEAIAAVTASSQAIACKPGNYDELERSWAVEGQDARCNWYQVITGERGKKYRELGFYVEYP